jgi:hypothetical protein
VARDKVQNTSISGAVHCYDRERQRKKLFWLETIKKISNGDKGIDKMTGQ